MNLDGAGDNRGKLTDGKYLKAQNTYSIYVKYAKVIE